MGSIAPPDLETIQRAIVHVSERVTDLEDAVAYLINTTPPGSKPSGPTIQASHNIIHRVQARRAGETK